MHCWGSNWHGQLGAGFPGAENMAPVPVVGVDDAIAVVAGETHACIARQDGTVWCWGDNEHGKLALDSGLIVMKDAPVQIPGLSDIVALDAADDRTSAVDSAGFVWCWGDEWPPIPGDDAFDSWSVDGPYPDYLPTAVEGLADVVAVAVGGAHACALAFGGQVTCWGDNDYGELGSGVRWSTAPVKVVGLGPVM